jgi:endo-1,4-beta-xylanase
MNHSSPAGVMIFCFVLLAELVFGASISAQQLDSKSGEELGEMFNYAINSRESAHHHHSGFKGHFDVWLPGGHFTWEKAMNFKHESPRKFEYFEALTKKNLLKGPPILENSKIATLEQTSSGEGDNHHDYYQTTIPKKNSADAVVYFPLPKDLTKIISCHFAVWACSDKARKMTISMAPLSKPAKCLFSVVAELNPTWNYFAGAFPVKPDSGQYVLRFDQGKSQGVVDLQTNVALALLTESQTRRIEQGSRRKVTDHLLKEYVKWLANSSNILNPLNCLEVIPPTAVTIRNSDEKVMIDSDDGYRDRDVPVMSFNLAAAKPRSAEVEFAIKIPKKLPPGLPFHFYFQLLGSNEGDMSITFDEDGKARWHKVEPLIPDTWQPYGYDLSTGGQPASKRVLRIRINSNCFPIKISNLSIFIDTVNTADRANIELDEVKKRTDLERCGPISISVKNKLGIAIKDATVKVVQQRLDFHFGCQSDGLNPLDQSASQKTFQKQFCDLFDLAAAPAYWDELEPTQGKPKYANLEAKARWCSDHHIYFLITDLLSAAHYPSWASSKPAEAGLQIKKHVLDTIAHFGAQVSAWEVAHNLTPTPGENDKQSHSFFGWVSSLPKETLESNQSAIALQRLLNWAHRAASDHALDFFYREDNFDVVPFILIEKKKFGSVPKAFEVKLNKTTENRDDMVEIWRICNLLSRYDKPVPLSITNVVIKSNVKPGAPPKQKTDDPDELQQAKRAEEVYRLLFSHPNVSSIIWRDLEDDQREPKQSSGLVRSDGTTKPAYDTLLKLIHNEWRTNLQGKTDSNGMFNARIYYGDHLVTVSDGKGHTVTQQVHFPKKDNRDVTIQIAL